MRRRIRAVIGAVAVAAGLSAPAPADPVPKGWVAQNMRPIGFSGLAWVLRYTPKGK